MTQFYRDLKRLPNLINGFLVRKIIQGIFAKTEKYFERSNVSMHEKHAFQDNKACLGKKSFKSLTEKHTRSV